MIHLDALDEKLLESFRGFVVKKDLVRTLKVGANVPVFVLEYLIANSCSTDDEEKIKQGMDNVKKILSQHYVNPEESNLVQSRIREKGTYKIIDKISVKLDTKKDVYWAQLQNSNIKNGVISDAMVSAHDKMLMGGIWAIIDIEYDSFCQRWCCRHTIFYSETSNQFSCPLLIILKSSVKEKSSIKRNGLIVLLKKLWL